MPPKIDTELCEACGTCDLHCPGDVILQQADQKPIVLYPQECWHCGACRQDCPTDAISIVFPIGMLNV